MPDNLPTQVQAALQELTDHSYLVRQLELAMLLRPYASQVIPVLVERLADHSENYHNRHNALEMLSLLAEPQAVLPVIRHMEVETGWTGHLFEYLRKGLAERDAATRQQVNAQLIRYLEEGPHPPAPKPFDPAASETQFNAFLKALMQSSGVTELDAESQALAEEAKKIWTRPPDVSELYKDRIPEYQNILVEALDTLTEFDGLWDPRLPGLLVHYVREYGFKAIAAQHALTALARLHPARAEAELNAWAADAPVEPNPTIRRAVHRAWELTAAPYEFTLCAREPGAEPWQERPYYFRQAAGLVFYLARGVAEFEWFAGLASDPDEAVRQADAYLERWLRSLEALNGKQTQTGKYARVHAPDRYAECLQRVWKHIDFEKWGFQQTHISQAYEYPWERPLVIYDSAWCRVRVRFSSYGEMHDQSDVLSVWYGRRHAADKDDLVYWQGEPHYCWHHVSLALCFLDGMSTPEAAGYLWSHPLIKQFHETPFEGQPDREAALHAAIWERYGQRLFELFDVRRPEAWDAYRRFLQEVYPAAGLKYRGHGVPREQIC